MSGTFNTYLIMSKAILTLACSILISGPSFGADRPVPDNVVFEKDIEFSNPDNQYFPAIYATWMMICLARNPAVTGRSTNPTASR
jgi:hypothetical protein